VILRLVDHKTGEQITLYWL